MTLNLGVSLYFFPSIGLAYKAGDFSTLSLLFHFLLAILELWLHLPLLSSLGTGSEHPERLLHDPKDYVGSGAQLVLPFHVD